MISNRLSRRGFCYAAFLALLPAVDEKLNLGLPEPEFQIGERVRTERICDDCLSLNCAEMYWESGFVVGYIWEYHEWRKENFRSGWTYWIRFDKTNFENLGDRSWIDFVHHTEVTKE